MKRSGSLWSLDGKTCCYSRNRALNEIFNAVLEEEFRRISIILVAKEDLIILESTHKGTKAVRAFKQQMLTSKFEEIMMSEKFFDEFYV